MEAKRAETSKSAEVILTDTARFAIFSAQLDANLPLSVVNGKLSEKYLSPSFILHCLFHVVFVLCLITLGFSSEELGKEDDTYGTTETVLMSFFLIANTILLTFYRLYAFWNRKSTLKFWKRNVAILDLFLLHTQTASYATPTSLPVLLNKSLIRIRTSLRNYLVTVFVLIICFLATAYPFYGEYTTDAGIGFVLSINFFVTTMLIQAAEGIWLSFFLKFYTALFRCIAAKLRILNTTFSDNSLNTMEPLNLFGNGNIEVELNECYNLFIKVGEQVEDFCSHFQTRLLTGCLLSSFQIIFCIFLFIRWVMDCESLTKRIGSVNSLVEAAIFGKFLYSLGTEGSHLTGSASEITNELHHLYYKIGSRLSFRCRQTLQVFLMKISTNPPVVDVSKFFIFDRKMISTVRF